MRASQDGDMTEAQTETTVEALEVGEVEEGSRAEITRTTLNLTSPRHLRLMTQSRFANKWVNYRLSPEFTKRILQVEFYFSDSNLPMDKFLLEQVGGSKNNSVKIETLHSFKRMRRFQPFSAIVDALKDSNFLELTEDDTCVRRKVPLPETLDDGLDEEVVKVFEDKAMPRSVYVKGFGEEVPSTQFDIEAFFAPYGPTNAIRLRRNNEKLFKGSVFVEFETDDLQKAFLELETKPKWDGKELQIMSKKQYCDQKVEDIKAGKIKSNNSYDRDRRNPNRSDGRFGDQKRKRDDEDDRDWRTRRDEDRKNGFRDDKRRNNRDRDSRPSRGHGGGRSAPVEKDDRQDGVRAAILNMANFMLGAYQWSRKRTKTSQTTS